MSKNAPATIPTVHLPAIVPGRHELSYADMFQLAGIYANSSLFPAHLRGKAEDCFIVVQLAERLKADHLAIAQNTYVVQGKPGMEAKMIIALINRSGQFKSRLRFRLEGEGNKRTAIAYAIDHDGQPCESAYSMQTAIDEGLVGKPQSKWKTMPDIMLQYRAATQFSRLFCPDVTMGMAVFDDDRQVIEGEIIAEPEPVPVQTVQAEPEAAPAQPHAQEPDDLEPLRADYRSWPQNKREAYERKYSELTDSGSSKDDAIRGAHAHVTNYFQ